MGFGVYRSGSTLAASLSSVFESLPVSSSEYRPSSIFGAIYNLAFSQMAPTIVSRPPQLLTSPSLGRFTYLRSAYPY